MHPKRLKDALTQLTAVTFAAQLFDHYVAQCAAKLADQFSIAGVLGLTGEGGGIGSTIGTAFLGNTFSGISDTITHVATGHFGAAYDDFALGGRGKVFPVQRQLQESASLASRPTRA